MGQQISGCIQFLRGPLSALLIMLVTACSPAPIVPADAGVCFPDSLAVVPGAQPVPGVRPNPRLYFDASGSMRYFGVAKADRRSGRFPFVEMAGTLLSLGPELGGELNLRGFGESIQPVTEPAIQTLLEGGKGFCAECNPAKSLINVVFEEILRDQPSVALVVTDLWLADDTQLRHGPSVLLTPLKAILSRGDAIAVLGVDARYTGPVFDMPPPVTTLPEAQRRRPLFVLVIGQSDLVKRAVATIQEDAFSGAQAGELHVTIYDPNVFANAAVPNFGYRLAGLDDKIVQAGTILQDQGVFIDAPQFAVNKAEGDRVRVARTVTPADVPDTAGLVVGEATLNVPPSFAWEGEVEIAGEIFTNLAARSEEICLQDSWVDAEVGNMSELVRGKVTGQKLEVRFDAGAESLRPLQPGKVQYLAFQATFKSLSSPNSASTWMLERSFTSAPEDVAGVSQREVFPTLNLAEFAGRLDAALSEQLAGEPIASGGFAFEVK